MHTLMVAFYFLLSLIGCDNFGAHSIVTQASEHGVEVLHSEASITPLLARFSCVSSASGRCHYRINPDECRHAAVATSLPACGQNDARQFVLAVGRSATLPDLPAGFSFCVDQVAQSADAPCKSEQRSEFSL